MKKRGRILLVVLVTPIALAGLAFLALVAYSELSRPPDEWGWLEEYSVDQEVFTAKEAYTLIQPLIHKWHKDGIVTAVWAGNLWSDDPNFTVRPDGRNGMWHFIVCSAAGGRWVSVMVVRGTVGLGVYDKPWGTLDEGECTTPLPIDDIIDSDAAILTARCLAYGLQPLSADVVSYDQYTRLRIPYSWRIDFAPAEGGPLTVFIEGSSGMAISVVRHSGDTIPLAELPPC